MDGILFRFAFGLLLSVALLHVGAVKYIDDLPIFMEREYGEPLLDDFGEPIPNAGGACGEIIFRRERVTGAAVAIKVVSELEELSFVMNEIYILDRLLEENVPNVVRKRGAYRSPDYTVVFIVTDFVKGDTLGKLIVSDEWNLSEQTIARIFADLLTTLWHMDRLRMMHRDLKADNIMISRDMPPKVTLIDFGFGSILPRSTGYKLYEYVGSPSVMAPEVLREEAYDTRADRWSIFIVLAMVFERSPHSLFEHVCTSDCVVRHSDLDNQYEVDQIEFERMCQPFELSDAVPLAAQQLIRSVLILEPSNRPSLNRIMGNVWFELNHIRFPSKFTKPLERRLSVAGPGIPPPRSKRAQKLAEALARNNVCTMRKASLKRSFRGLRRADTAPQQTTRIGSTRKAGPLERASTAPTNEPQTGQKRSPQTSLKKTNIQKRRQLDRQAPPPKQVKENNVAIESPKSVKPFPEGQITPPEDAGTPLQNSPKPVKPVTYEKKNPPQKFAKSVRRRQDSTVRTRAR